ncbi:hypothetical protein V9T40_004296 [Parthenolecanium corni]|uniref:Actin-related protein 6 n=1 Tax=Parthenolecanium corni TaxID=536013 RepID=A0AAN9Y8H3_9HEMI
MVIACIIDNGAYSIKIDYSNAPEARIIPNCIMKAKSEKRRPFIGDQIDECRDASGLFYILGFQKGYLVNWEAQKTVWDYVFGEQCCKLNLKESDVIVTEPYFNFASIQEGMTEIFFEEYDCQSLLRVNPGDLSAYHYTKTNPKTLCCLVVDSGYSFTHIIPYIKGKKYKSGIVRIDVGGKLLTNHLKEVISYRQLHVMDETYVINQVKEDVCYVSCNFNEDMRTSQRKDDKNHIVRDYVLPDYTTIRRGHVVQPEQAIQNDYQKLRLSNERFTIPELLFHPSDVGIKQMGITEAIVYAISQCPPESHSYLYNNIVLTGGNMKFAGIKERIYNDVRCLVPEEYDVSVYLPDDPITYSWKGGALLSERNDFLSRVVTKDEYEDEGTQACYEKFDV